MEDGASWCVYAGRITFTVANDVCNGVPDCIIEVRDGGFGSEAGDAAGCPVTAGRGTWLDALPYFYLARVQLMTLCCAAAPAAGGVVGSAGAAEGRVRCDRARNDFSGAHGGAGELDGDADDVASAAVWRGAISHSALPSRGEGFSSRAGCDGALGGVFIFGAAGDCDGGACIGERRDFDLFSFDRRCVLGVALAWIVALCAAWMRRAKWTEARAIRKMFVWLGDGFRQDDDSAYAGHYTAFWSFLICIVFYVAIGIGKPFQLGRAPAVPTLADLLVFVMIVCWGFSAVAFVLDKWRIPLVMLFLIWFSVIACALDGPFFRDVGGDEPCGYSRRKPC